MNDIKLGNGLGNIKFGAKEGELKDALGEPSDIETSEDDGLTILHYDDENLSFAFSEDYGNRLLSVTSSDGDARIEEVTLIGDSLQEVLDKLEVLGITDVDIEDISSDEFPNQQLLTAFEYSLNLWFDEDELAEIQWGPFWDYDKDEPLWPN